MIIKTVDLEIVCGVTSALPQTSLPEFAFAGKSNVGKSSLINSLMNRKSFARTSAQPGKTRTMNWYNINKQLYFVDLPGYGFAKVPEAVKAQWGRMIERYLAGSGQLREVLLLVDIRHAPSVNDVQMYEWIIRSGFRPVVVATKADKLNRSQLAPNLKIIREKLGMTGTDRLIPFSAVTRQGRDEIWQLLEESAATPGEDASMA